jgi:HYR domain-containing protein
VNCSATDAHSNTANGSFTVTVQDTTPPSLTLPSDITAEATGPSGAAVTYTVSASDLVDGSVTVNCSPASGSTFPLGTTTVNCSATDAHSNTANGSFTVTVQDTTPPSLTLPSDITAEATSAAGAIVAYAASASDLVDGPVAVSCTPASGSTFAPGTTTVNCSATDAHSNTANGSFKVTVTFNWAGFFQPVDNKMLNGMKAGSTAPMKWQVSDGSGGFITSLSIVAKVLSGVQQCASTTPVDNLEEYATGGTQLRYDATSNQYIYNWQSPRKPGQCFQVDIVLTDGTQHVALFQLR